MFAVTLLKISKSLDALILNFILILSSDNIDQVPNKLDEVSMKTLSPESGEPTEEEVPSVTVKVMLKTR